MTLAAQLIREAANTEKVVAKKESSGEVGKSWCGYAFGRRISYGSTEKEAIDNSYNFLIRHPSAEMKVNGVQIVKEWANSSQDW